MKFQLILTGYIDAMSLNGNPFWYLVRSSKQKPAAATAELPCELMQEICIKHLLTILA